MDYRVVYRISSPPPIECNHGANCEYRKKHFQWHVSNPMYFADACLFAEKVYIENWDNASRIEKDNAFYGCARVVMAEWLEHQKLPTEYEVDEFFTTAPKNPVWRVPSYTKTSLQNVILEEPDKKITTIEIPEEALFSDTRMIVCIPNVLVYKNIIYKLKYSCPLVYERAFVFTVPEPIL